jgi:hypothetical protein
MDRRGFRSSEGSVAFYSYSLFLDRRSINVKAFTRGMFAAVVGLGLLGVAGCGPDNEAEGVKLGKAAGDPGPENPKATKVEAKPVNSQVEAYQRSQEQMKNMPGSKLKK